MRSASEDLTTQARIRDAAIALFGAQGYDGTSVRAIASSAGVSPALVLHHFGSKEGLREACDAWIVDEVMGRKEELARDGDLAATMQRWLADSARYRPSLDYLARTIVDGGDTGARLFAHLVDRTEAMLAAQTEAGMVRPSSDARMRAAIVATHGLVPLVLERVLAQSLGETGLSAALISRMTMPTLELYTHGLYTDTTVLDAAATALEGAPGTRRGPRSDKGAGDPNQDPDPPEGTRSSPAP